MHPTKNDLPEETREKMGHLLNDRLAGAIDLMLRGKQAHWNVKGPSFFALHELFDAFVDEAEGWGDDLAERAVALGNVAQGTLLSVSNRSRLPGYPMTLTSGTEHLEQLVVAVAHFGGDVREAIAIADQAGDAGTADLFTALSRAVDKRLWLFEAHLQG